MDDFSLLKSNGFYVRSTFSQRVLTQQVVDSVSSFSAEIYDILKGNAL